MHAERNFELLCIEMTDLGTNLNYASKNEHVPEMEHFILTIKERIRPFQSSMPLKQVSKIMIVHIFASVIFCINEPPPINNWCRTVRHKRPRKTCPWNCVQLQEILHLQSGKYVQVHQEYEPRNTIDIDQTVGAIILGPQFNIRGGYFFGVPL